MAGAEGDVEMMIARQSVFGDLGQRLAHHGAQSRFHHHVILQNLFSHDRRSGMRKA